MAAVPGTHTFTDGIAPSSEMNAFVRDPINFLQAPPICQLKQTIAQSITTATMTALLFDIEIVDTVDGHSTSVNTSRYTAVYAGWYQLSGGTGFASNTTNRRANRWAVNGTFLEGSAVYLPTTPTGTCETPSRTFFAYLNVGDYVEFQGYQDSGGSINTAVTADTYSTMSILRVST